MKFKENNLEDIDINEYPDIKKFKIAIIVSEWNNDITNSLYSGAYEKLTELGVLEQNISTSWVPGSFELIYACKKFANKDFDAIIAIGCIIKGETDHYDYICSSVSNGIMHLNLTGLTPIIFCVLTDHNKSQSIERSGGRFGNKGSESAIAAIKMASL